jgi:hypothetical protein
MEECRANLGRECRPLKNVSSTDGGAQEKQKRRPKNEARRRDEALRADDGVIIHVQHDYNVRGSNQKSFSLSNQDPASPSLVVSRTRRKWQWEDVK